MKILEIIPNLGSGGAERFLVDLSNELTQIDGVEIVVVTTYDLTKDNSFLKNALDTRIKIVSLHKKGGTDIGLFFRMFKLIREIKPDIAHFHVGAIPYSLISSLLNRSTKHYATIHSDAQLESEGGIKAMIRKLIFRSGLVKPITISEESKRSFKSFYGVDAPMIVNGVKKQIISDSDNPLSKYHGTIFVHIASVQKVKNQKLLITAFKRLISEGRDVSLIMIGRSDSYPQIYKTDIAPYLCDRIVHLGEREDVARYLHFADAFCLSSTMEGMPMTIIEAFSQGCPPICTPVGGIVNMINSGENGILSADLIEESYYQALKSYLDMTPEMRMIMKNNAVKSFAQYDITECTKQYFEFFSYQ